MTGKDWDNYFKTLNREYKEKLREALITLDNDPIIKREFGSSFAELASIIDLPLTIHW